MSWTRYLWCKVDITRCGVDRIVEICFGLSHGNLFCSDRPGSQVDGSEPCFDLVETRSGCGPPWRQNDSCRLHPPCTAATCLNCHPSGLGVFTHVGWHAFPVTGAALKVKTNSLAGCQLDQVQIYKYICTVVVRAIHDAKFLIFSFQS